MLDASQTTAAQRGDRKKLNSVTLAQDFSANHAFAPNGDYPRRMGDRLGESHLTDRKKLEA